MADHNLDVCAHLVRIAHAFTGGHGRYYIHGVRIEPAATGGVIIVATDGHTLIALFDEDGFTPRPVTLRLRKHVRRAWKRKSSIPTRLRMTLADEATDAPAEIVTIYAPERQIVRAVAHAPEIAGEYPDWRRVVPGMPDAKLPSILDGAATLLGGHLLARFGKTADRLRLRHRVNPLDLQGAIALHSGGPDAPTFVRFAKGIPAFGAIMPVKEDATVPAVPGWALPATPRSEVTS